MVILIMGVAGSGKTTIGKLISRHLGCIFIDADDLHSESNKSKMRQGIPLTDEDRSGWLSQVHEMMANYCTTNRNAVVACSALKESYRRVLLEGIGQCTKVMYLKTDYEAVKARLDSRKNHFFNPALLKSQFETLEEPSNCIVVDASLQPHEIVEFIVQHIDA